MNYVNGFMIKPATEEVLFLQKNRPAFQNGKWNGVGGKMDKPGETAKDAMVREFWEEAGVVTDPLQWEHTCTVIGGNDGANPGKEYSIYFFRHFVDTFPDVKAMTDEPIAVWKLADIYRHQDYLQVPGHPETHLPTLPNMRFILPLQFSSTVQLPIVFRSIEAH